MTHSTSDVQVFVAYSISCSCTLIRVHSSLCFYDELVVVTSTLSFGTERDAMLSHTKYELRC